MSLSDRCARPEFTTLCLPFAALSPHLSPMIDSAQPTALYEQVAHELEKQIRAGTLRPGDRVPSVRRASEQHRVSVTTAVQAYLSLENRGLIEARPKSGFYVRVPRRVHFLEPKPSQPSRKVTSVGVASLQ